MAASAIPADPEPKPVLQADGSIITVTIRGDEYGHAIFDADGRRVAFNRANGMFERVDGDLPAAGLPHRVRIQPNKVRINSFPTTGKQKSLVILLEFSDTPFMSVANPYDYFNRMLNQEGFRHDNGADGSARDFYLASSDGKFDPTFVVAGPVTLSREATYYGSDASCQDCRMGEAIREACEALDDEIDFAEYDADGDGYVDNIFFFYAGYGQADHPQGTDFIWPHSADVGEAWGLNLVYDGKKIGNYACSNEVRYSTAGEIAPSGIGTFVHEFGHVLGLADHYDTGYGLLSFDPGAWDTMASGSYNNNMHTPPLFSAFERAELGWMEYTELPATPDGILDLPWLGEGEGFAYRISVDGKDNEWFVIENRQQLGWDAYLPGHGMLIWHIDMDEEAWQTNSVNTDPYHQRVDIVEVDGISSDMSRGGDVMPGTAGITSYTLTSWDGAEAAVFDDVCEDDGVVRMLLASSTFRLPAPESIDILSLNDDSFSFDWVGVDDAAYYLVSVSCAGTAVGDLDSKRYDSVTTVNLGNLAAETVYDISVVAVRGSFRSSPCQTEVSTPELAFNKRKCESVWAEDIGYDCFTAHYSPVKDADEHIITLFTVERAATATELGYGFEDKADGMPATWATSSSLFFSVSGYYGEDAPSLRMADDGDFLSIAYPESLIDHISFWHKANGSGCRFVVEIPDAGGWTTVDVVELSKESGVFETDLDGVEKVRVRLERDSGYAVIDDITVSCRGLERIPVKDLEDTKAGTIGEHTFSGLVPDMTYGFVVTALKKEEASLVSDECIVSLGNSGVSDVSTPAYPVCYYNLMGHKSLRPFPGVNIVVYSDGSVRKTFVQ